MDYSALTVVRLRELLGERGLKKTGLKRELIARLEEYDRQQLEEEEEEEPFNNEDEDVAPFDSEDEEWGQPDVDRLNQELIDRLVFEDTEVQKPQTRTEIIDEIDREYELSLKCDQMKDRLEVVTRELNDRNSEFLEDSRLEEFQTQIRLSEDKVQKLNLQLERIKVNAARLRRFGDAQQDYNDQVRITTLIESEKNNIARYENLIDSLLANYNIPTLQSELDTLTQDLENLC